MLSHIFIGDSDFAAAHAFYAPLMEALGLRQRFFDPDNTWAAFMAQDRATVLRVYHAALAAGATDEGPPGQRPHCHADDFGAYCRDLDGNKLCVVCHAVE